MNRPVCECCGSRTNLDVIEITEPTKDKNGHWFEDCRESNLILLCHGCEKKLRTNTQDVLMHLKYSNYRHASEDPRVKRYCTGWAVMNRS